MELWASQGNASLFLHGCALSMKLTMLSIPLGVKCVGKRWIDNTIWLRSLGNIARQCSPGWRSRAKSHSVRGKTNLTTDLDTQLKDIRCNVVRATTDGQVVSIVMNMYNPYETLVHSSGSFSSVKNDPESRCRVMFAALYTSLSALHGVYVNLLSGT